MLRLVKLTTCLSFVSLLLAACGGGSGEGLDQNGQPDNTGGTTPPPSTPVLTADIASIQVNVLTPSCGVSGCHVQGTAAFNLILDSVDASINNLINVPAGQVPSLLRVEPFDPDNSYLIQKLEGTGAGAQMPFGQPALDPSVITVVRQWISDGALIPTAASIQANLFDAQCIECHFGAAPAGDLNLEDGNSFTNLINISRFPSDPDYPIRVIPGDSDNSFLIRKLEGDLSPTEGSQMPLNKTPLSQDAIDIIRQWIDDGAIF